MFGKRKKFKIWYSMDRRTKAPLFAWTFKPDKIAMENGDYNPEFHVIKSVEVEN